MIKKRARKYACYYLLFVAGLAVFSILSFRRMQQTVSCEELTVLAELKRVFGAGLREALHAKEILPGSFLLVHPPLYMYAVLRAFTLFGPNELNARMVGIFSGLLAIILVFLSLYIFIPGDRIRRVKIASLTSLCYALAPTTIQGSILIQVDTTILVPLILSTVLCAALYMETKKRIWLGGLGISIALSFWSRFSTPSAIIALIAVYFLISNIAVPIRVKVISALLCGVAAFFVSWVIYCWVFGISWLTPFVYTLGMACKKAVQTNISQWVLGILYPVFWLGPLMLLAIAIALIRAGHSFLKGNRDADPCGLFLFCGFAALIGFSAIGGAHHGYPRYYSPIFPLIYIGLALTFFREHSMFPQARKAIIIFLFVFLAQLIIIGDQLYGIRYILREAAVFAPERVPEIIKGLAAKFSLFLLFCAILLRHFVKPLRINTFIGFLVICSVAASIGMTVSQSFTRYYTGFNYGGQGSKDVVRYLRSTVDTNNKIIAPNAIISQLGLSLKEFIKPEYWLDTKAIRDDLRDINVCAFIYNIATHSIDELKAIRQDSILTEILDKQFEYKKIGNYHVWTRKK